MSTVVRVDMFLVITWKAILTVLMLFGIMLLIALRGK